jgi:Flp pilus assembly protein TadG
VRNQRGAAAVEFALVLPILLLVVFGIINFGIVLAQKSSLANAVRAGARYGTVNSYTTTHTCRSVIDKVRGSASTIGIGTSTSTQIAVTVTRLKPDGTAYTPSGCSVAAGVASSGASLTPPCENGTADKLAPDTLSIETTFDSKLLIPTPGLGNSFTLTTSGSFQCEYN